MKKGTSVSPADTRFAFNKELKEEGNERRQTVRAGGTGGGVVGRVATRLSVEGTTLAGKSEAGGRKNVGGARVGLDCSREMESV